MPNIHLTGPMHDYAQRQIASGVYANLSEVVRMGIRLLMEKDDLRASSALKVERRTQAAAGLRAMMASGPEVSEAQLQELRAHDRR